MVFPDAEYAASGIFTYSNSQYTFTHKAYGADMFRYSPNFGQNWTTWANWEDTTQMDADVFDSDDNWWDGHHIMVQCSYYQFFVVFFFFLLTPKDRLELCNVIVFWHRACGL